MDMKNRTALCDFFIVMSAPSSVRVKTIVDSIEEALRDRGIRIMHREGYAEACWVLLDCGPVIAHIFYHETRKFYDLEHLWGDAPKKKYLKEN